MASSLKPRRAANTRILALRSVILVVLLAAAISGRSVLVWLSLPLFLGLWHYVALRNHVFLRNLRGLHRLAPESEDGEDDATLPGVTVISPARNEEADIERAVRSLAGLDYPNLEVIVVNDHSTDQTPRILRRLGDEFPRLRVIHDPPLQEDWRGKANAIWHAVQESGPGNKWLLLTDADVIQHPKALRRAVAYAEAHNADFCTCVPWIDNGTLAEELVIPYKWSAIVMCAHYDRLNQPKTAAIGIGAFTLVKRKAYLDSGGHSAFHNQQPEDTLLARLIKKRGGVMAVVWTCDMVRVRVARGLRQILDYATRKNRIVFNDSLQKLLSQALRWLLIMVLPLPLAIAALAHQFRTGFRFGLSLYALLALGTYYSGARNYRLARSICRIRAGVPWLHPIGGLVKFWIEVNGMLQILFNRKMTWRGRDFVNVRTQAPETNAGEE